MATQRVVGVHELRIVHPDLVGARQPPARAVHQAVVGLFLRCRNLVDRDLLVTSECSGHGQSSPGMCEPVCRRVLEGTADRREQYARDEQGSIALVAGMTIQASLLCAARAL